MLDDQNTASDVWGDTCLRSAANEALLTSRGVVSRVHRNKPKARRMGVRTRRSNARKSVIRAAVEHVFARQQRTMGLVIRTIGLARAEVKIGLANLVYNIKRYVRLTRSQHLLEASADRHPPEIFNLNAGFASCAPARPNGLIAQGTNRR